LALCFRSSWMVYCLCWWCRFFWYFWCKWCLHVKGRKTAVLSFIKFTFSEIKHAKYFSTFWALFLYLVILYHKNEIFRFTLQWLMWQWCCNYLVLINKYNKLVKSNDVCYTYSSNLIRVQFGISDVWFGLKNAVCVGYYSHLLLT